MNAIKKTLTLSLAVVASASLATPAFASYQQLWACSSVAGTPIAQQARPLASPNATASFPTVADCHAHDVYRGCWTGPNDNWADGISYVAGQMWACEDTNHVVVRQVRVYAFGALAGFRNSNPSYPNMQTELLAVDINGGSTGGVTTQTTQVWSGWNNVTAATVKVSLQAYIWHS